MIRYIYTISILLLPFMLQAQWETLKTQDSCIARHETGFVALSGDLYLLGGRGIKPVEKYAPKNNTWTKLKPTPIEIHHFTPVSVNNKIYIVAGMTGPYPKELPITHVYSYEPGADNWEKLIEIPEGRRRGGAGVAVYNGKIYVVNGITYGHTSGTCAMFDVFNPADNSWTILPDAPHIRDHSGAAIVNDKLIAIGGRNTSYHEEDNFTAFFATVKPEIDYYDFKTGKWSTYASKLPAPSAGAGVVAWNNKVYFIGGETGEPLANNQVYAFDPSNETWTKKPFLNRGRHGTNAVLSNGAIYIAAGCANRGGSPELNSIEVYREAKK